MVCGKKKGCPRERNLREINTENNVGTVPVFFFYFAYKEGVRGRKIFSGPGA
jgi:hypothetical protein